MDGVIMKNRSALAVRGSTTGASCNCFTIAPKTSAAPHGFGFGARSLARGQSALDGTGM
jgi:hypothetical protein